MNRESAGHEVIQMFTTNPEYTTKLTVPGGGSIAWTPPANAKYYQFQPSASVVQKLNDATDGFSFAANVISPAYGIHDNVATVTFVAVAGTTIVIQAGD